MQPTRKGLPSCLPILSAILLCFAWTGRNTPFSDGALNPEPGSGTTRQLTDPSLLASKLAEEAGELAAATTREEAVHETADVLYFALVALAKSGGTLEGG